MWRLKEMPNVSSEPCKITLRVTAAVYRVHIFLRPPPGRILTSVRDFILTLGTVCSRDYEVTHLSFLLLAGQHWSLKENDLFGCQTSITGKEKSQN